MSMFNVAFLLPGYLRADSVAASADGGAPIEAVPRQGSRVNEPVPMQWHQELLQLPWQYQLCRQLGLNGVDAETLPVARLLAGTEDPSAAVVCADPVHLQADRDTATLLPSAMLTLSDQESEELIASFNEFVASDGWQFFRDSAGSWFMQGMDGSALSSFPPSFLAHRNASSYLPDGEGSEHWRRLMAELQMLLHTHPVNQAREQRGQLTVNSLWFWGGGSLPARPANPEGVNANDMTVFSDQPFAIALCEYLQVPRFALQAFDSQVVNQAIVVDTRIADTAFAGDEEGMRAARRLIDNDWLLPLCQRIASSRSGKFQLINEDGECAVRDALTPLSVAGSSGLWMSIMQQFSRIGPWPRWLTKPFTR